MPLNALVTGAYGFVGRYMSRHLFELGWEVVGIGHGTWSEREWGRWGLAAWHQSEITLDGLITYGGTPDLIVHCAGSGAVGFSLSHPMQDFQRTVMTTLNTLEFARIHSPDARIVYPSSAAVYGAAKRLPVDEADPLVPLSPYGVHKKMAEELCASYARHSGQKLAIVRLFSVYGPGLQKQLLWEACKKISNGQTNFFGVGDELRDWIHITDAVRLMKQAAEFANSSCPIVNGAGGSPVSVRDVLNRLFNELGIASVPTFDNVERLGDPRDYHASIGRAQAWGWKPRVVLTDGLREYAEWYKQNLNIE